MSGLTKAQLIEKLIESENEKDLQYLDLIALKAENECLKKEVEELRESLNRVTNDNQ